MSHTININGAPYPPLGAGGDKPPPTRLNIADLIANEKQFSLYVQAISQSIGESFNTVLT